MLLNRSYFKRKQLVTKLNPSLRMSTHIVGFESCGGRLRCARCQGRGDFISLPPLRPARLQSSLAKLVKKKLTKRRKFSPPCKISEGNQSTSGRTGAEFLPNRAVGHFKCKGISVIITNAFPANYLDKSLKRTSALNVTCRLPVC